MLTKWAPGIIALIHLLHSTHNVAFQCVLIHICVRTIRNMYFVVNNVSVLICFLSVCREHYYPGLWERVIEEPSNSITKQGLRLAIQQMLENNESAVIIDLYKSINYMAVKSRYCNWGFMDDRFYHSFMSFPLPKGSPFVSVFSNV